MSPPSEAPCQETTGFLFSHACGEPMEAACDRCGKILCRDHVSSVQGESLCMTCAEEEEDDEGDEGADSDSDSSPTEDDPSYYYDDYGYYGGSTWGGGSSKDPNDFTEADGESLRNEDDASFEEDLGGS
ncbi:hypothetical protein HPC49_14845 [Pyxidicoccus fallax]|uniref:Uncharacterized protein n=1 Tax=Pyxidicoccus fallax TaxID=394095 RepID=A0A848LJW7_9BACT|nr:hypothetical protein [Pyxidicoccus fallax]NMO18003.1 hypothetical protein [Pyxidicoccus fallax]NPC79510.1 hypothetical protein [Pyxidicoccus fallax]